MPALRLPPLLILLALAACEPQDPDGRPAPPPADAPKAAPAPAALPPNVLDISQSLTARGTEPFWALVIDGTKMTLKRPDHPDLVFDAPGAAVENGRAVWVARSAEGQQLTATIYVSDCSDGMSDARYPMAAEVVLLNERLHGCAAKTAKTAKTAEAPRGG